MLISFDDLLLVSGVLLITSVVSSKISTKFGVPALLIFIFVGMLAGAEGPWGIDFSDFVLVHDLGVLALILILFSGGLDTNWVTVRKVLGAGISLATIGVAVTALVVGACAYYILQFSLLEALLLGAIVSSTDAAAVFGVLRAQGLKLRGNLTPLLELESGGNDPMAVFLTIALTGLVLNPDNNALHLLPELFFGMILGGVGGALFGVLSAWAINRIHLAYDGLYNVFTVGVALIAYAGIHSLGGNGFLAVYASGVALGSRPLVHRISLIHFHEGIAWLMQIVMFLSLGLLVYPSQLLPRLSDSLILAFVLVLVARPLAVMASLMFARGYTYNDKLFISWAGLRGAVPIILATIPMISGVSKALVLFNVVFFVVLVSVLVQGTAIRWVARFLGVISDEISVVTEKKYIASKLQVRILPDSPVIGRSVVELNLPSSILLILLTRGTESHIPRGNTVFRAGDTLLVQAQGDSIDEVRKIFTGLRNISDTIEDAIQDPPVEPEKYEA